jgi:hypothetical protein
MFGASTDLDTNQESAFDSSNCFRNETAIEISLPCLHTIVSFDSTLNLAVSHDGRAGRLNGELVRLREM